MSRDGSLERKAFSRLAQFPYARVLRLNYITGSGAEFNAERCVDNPVSF